MAWDGRVESYWLSKYFQMKGVCKSLEYFSGLVKLEEERHMFNCQTRKLEKKNKENKLTMN